MYFFAVNLSRYRMAYAPKDGSYLPFHCFGLLCSIRLRSYENLRAEQNKSILFMAKRNNFEIHYP